jgi:hypothetical protein
MLMSWMGRETPLEVRPGEVADVEVGTLVTVAGVVTDVRSLGGGYTSLSLEDGPGGEVEVFLAFDPGTIQVGDGLQVTGRVTVYHGEVEVMVEDDHDLRVLSRSRSPETSLARIVREPWLFEDSEPRVRVSVVTPPVADLNGEDLWCLLTDPEQPKGPCGLALLGPDIATGTWEAGVELDLRVAVRYDASSGFVYLEVLGLA